MGWQSDFINSDIDGKNKKDVDAWMYSKLNALEKENKKLKKALKSIKSRNNELQKAINIIMRKTDNFEIMEIIDKVNGGDGYPKAEIPEECK